MKKPTVIVILGETATGKSNLAVKIAKKINGKNGAEIISADSRQIYKDLDIGTGKITEKEMKGIPHHMLDVANIKRPARAGGNFTVKEYQEKAKEILEDIIKHEKIPIICGGTGFYIDAITKGTVFPSVPPNLKLRKVLEKLSAEKLFVMLKRLDKRRAENIDMKNKVRLIRAIEIAKALGKVPPLRQDLSGRYKFIKIGLYLPEEKLKKKIEKRVKTMFDKNNHGGLLNEIKKLKKAGVTEKRLYELGFEYDNPTYEKVVSGSIKYAKRQMTYFKTDKEIKWFDASVPSLDSLVLLSLSGAKKR